MRLHSSFLHGALQAVKSDPALRAFHPVCSKLPSSTLCDECSPMHSCASALHCCLFALVTLTISTALLRPCHDHFSRQHCTAASLHWSCQPSAARCEVHQGCCLQWPSRALCCAGTGPGRAASGDSGEGPACGVPGQGHWCPRCTPHAQH